MIGQYRVTALIPARGGSKRLPRKNVKLLVDKPLIAWSIEVAKASKYIDRVVVSTDDEEIKQAIKDEYETALDSRYDVMDYVTNEEKDDSVGSDIFALILILIAVGGIVGGIMYARKKA